MPSKRKLEESLPFKDNIGVCLNDQMAFVLERRSDENLITVISAEDQSKPNLNAYYKKVFDSLRDFRHIRLFGPKKSTNEIERRIKAHKLDFTTILDAHPEETPAQDKRIDFSNEYFSDR